MYLKLCKQNNILNTSTTQLSNYDIIKNSVKNIDSIQKITIYLITANSHCGQPFSQMQRFHWSLTKELLFEGIFTNIYLKSVQPLY